MMRLPGLLGKFFLTIRDKFILRLLSYFKVYRRLYPDMIEFLGTTTVLFGTVISAMGLYGLARGIGITFAVGEGVIAFPMFLAGILTSLVGILLVFEGTALTYTVFKLPRLVILSIVLGFCSLNVPAILLGTGYSLAAGITAIVLGYTWLTTVFAWLLRGE